MLHELDVCPPCSLLIVFQEVQRLVVNLQNHAGRLMWTTELVPDGMGGMESLYARLERVGAKND